MRPCPRVDGVIYAPASREAAFSGAEFWRLLGVLLGVPGAWVFDAAVLRYLNGTCTMPGRAQTQTYRLALLGFCLFASVLPDASTVLARLCVFTGLAYLVAFDTRTDH